VESWPKGCSGTARRAPTGLVQQTRRENGRLPYGKEFVTHYTMMFLLSSIWADESGVERLYKGFQDPLQRSGDSLFVGLVFPGRESRIREGPLCALWLCGLIWLRPVAARVSACRHWAETQSRVTQRSVSRISFWTRQFSNSATKISFSEGQAIS
jgi:hypothetical protein